MSNIRKKGRFILEIVKKNLKYFVLTFIIAGICSLLNLVIPIIIEKFIDIIADGEYTLKSKLSTYIVLYMFCSLGIYIFTILKNLAAKNLGWQVANNLRMIIINKIISYDQSFFNQYSSGDIVEFLNKDIKNLYSFLSDSAVEILVNVLTIIGIIVVLLNKNILIGVLFAIFIMLLFFIIYKIQSLKSNILIEERDYNSGVTSFYKECIDARKEIKILGKTKEILLRLDKIFKEWLPLKVKSQKYLYMVWIATLISLGVANCLSLAIGGAVYIKNLITIGTVYLLYSYSNLLKQPMEYMQAHIQSVMRTFASLDRLDSVTSYKCMVKDGTKKLANGEINIKIKELEHFFDNKKVLKNINLNIENNSRVGIFGVSGSGKSTLCKLLCKLEGVQKGQILINDIDINELSVNTVREKVALLTTSGQIFEGTFKDNVTLFQNISDKEVINVLDKYNIADLFNIDKSKLLYYQVSERSLSSGQKQIINLCRLFFQEKSVLIFDEASSRVDENIEDKFYFILEELMQSKTSIIVTHNVERLKKCDSIVVMDMGKIIEHGKRNVLSKDTNSLYSQFVNKRLEVTK